MFLLIVVYAACAGAATLKTWTAGESITADQLNGNFSIVNSRSLAAKSAAAAATATATNGPQAVLAFGNANTATTVCSASPCTLNSSYNVTSVTRSGAGVYVITFNATHTNPKILIVNSQVKGRPCYASPTFGATTTTETINCYADYTAGAAAADSTFIFSLVEP